jgi:rhodanese-related sulfurtransferase/predicted metal-dependent enzyme (double-stranded beta helix superfamily)
VTAVTATPSGPGAERDRSAVLAREADVAGHSAGSGLKPGWGVSPERQQAVADTLGGLAPDCGRLSPPQLRAITVTLAARRELWDDLVVHDPNTRWYLPLHRSNSCDVWLLAWERGQDTDWHDHGGSSGSFAVADGSLTEQYRVPSGHRQVRRHLTLGEAVAFGPGHVHDVAHGGDASATSIHAYSPPLSAMTYYSATDYGLIARETVAIDGPEGGRGHGGADTALAAATASAARLTGDALPDGAPGIDELLAEARSGLTRLRPEAAFAAITDSAILIDIRPLEQRIIEGEVPGAIIISRNVLEWRLDPRSEARIPALARPDARLILMCSQGYASSLAASSLRRLGLTDATDLDGGFQAWQAAGLPTQPAHALG